MAWSYKKLEEVLVLNRSGYWGDDAATTTRPIPVKVIRNADITKDNSIKGSISRYFSAKEATNAELRVGDIAMSSSGDVGKAWLVNEAGYSASNFIRILRPASEMVLPRFLKYVLESADGQSTLASSTAGTTIQNLQKSFYSKLTIPLPPLSEQQRIVRLLDEAFEGIAIAKANAEKNLQNSRALFESYLQSVFTKRGDGWEIKKISEIATHSLGKMLDKAKNKGEFQPYLRNLNVRWAEIDLSNVLEMRFLPSDAEKYTVLKGDVLVCEGGYPGRAAIWANDDPIYFQKALHRVRFHEKGRNRWFLYYLIAKDADGTLKSHFNGTGIQHFTGEALARFEVPLPPLREQDELLDRLDNLRETSLELSKAYSAKMTALDNLKAAFLGVAFSGNLLKAA